MGKWDVLVPNSECSVGEVFRQKDELMLLLAVMLSEVHMKRFLAEK